ncbi:M1 family metallopeptidase [Chitinophaga pendula]|nr:M1 family metallopeptidase [Chitinophaga pendula]
MLCTALTISAAVSAQQTKTPLHGVVQHYTHADTLRGTYGRARAWWDVKAYNLHVSVNTKDSTLSGYNKISYKVLKADSLMQIDLQVPMEIDSIVQDKKSIPFERDGNAFFVTLKSPQIVGNEQQLTVFYHGKPKRAINAPWDGGVVWKRDDKGRPWIATACQGLGASVWWPNKDHQLDEAEAMTISVTVPEKLINVSNGRLKKRTAGSDSTNTFEWEVQSPINNYNVALNIGHYVEIKDRYSGEGGKLDLSYWVLDYNEEKAREHFKVVPNMLKCFEFWFGKYPFYKDGYKLVETPHLGMEHQSAVAYGNKYKMGYNGRDLSGSGWGLKWDFIVIHESGHEWFGNNITSKDIADMWIHESFTNYSETLFTECEYGPQAGSEYVQGIRQNIKNDIPVIGPYNVNIEGSGDMYYKGANMIHMIRQIINNDEAFRQLLRGMNKTFWHQTVTTQQIEKYINEQTGMDFSKVFDQYLRHITIPKLEYKLEGQRVQFRWVTDVPGFNMPLKVTLGDRGYTFIYPTTTWKSANITLTDPASFKVDPNFYIQTQKL